MSEKRLSFFSPEWIAMVERELQLLLSASGPGAQDIDLTISEVYTEAPAGTPGRSADGAAGLVMRLTQGRATVRPGFADRYDIRLQGQWDDSRRSATLTGAEYEAFRNQRFVSGRLRFEGDPAKVPAFLQPLHDVIAARTA